MVPNSSFKYTSNSSLDSLSLFDYIDEILALPAEFALRTPLAWAMVPNSASNSKFTSNNSQHALGSGRVPRGPYNQGAAAGSFAFAEEIACH